MNAINIMVSMVSVMMIFFTGQTAHGGQQTDIPAQLPIQGMVTMIDLGATKCIPCKMMAPILKELEEKYRGRGAIVFIDVWENEGYDKKFGIRTIPTQIFYDHTGKEVYRHEGFLDRKYIVNLFMKLGVPLDAGARPVMAPPSANPQPVQGRPPLQASAGGVARIQPSGASQAAPAPALGRPAAGMAAGLLTPGMVNFLYLDTNVSQPKERVWKVFGELEKAYPQKVTLLVLDANTNLDMMRNLGVRAVPTLIVYGPGGQEAARYPGMPDLPEIQAVLAPIIIK